MKNRKLKVIGFLILSFILIINSLFLVSGAVDTKMKVNYCEFAVSNTNVAQWKFESSSGAEESEVFKDWDAVNQEGIFMRVDNQNLVLGEASDYEFTRYTPNKPWFNEFGSDGTESDIPIINVGNEQDKYIYTRCKFKIGDYRIFIFDKSFYNFNFLTNDFNLTTGIFPYDTFSGTPHVSTYGPYLSLTTVSSRLNNFNLGESGLFPYTELYIIYKTGNLAQKPSSYVRFGMSWMIRELGRVNLVSDPSPSVIVYINNSNPDYTPENFLKVTQLAGDIVKKDEDTGDSATGYGINLKIIPGHNYSMIVPFENRYNIPLSMSFRYGIRMNDWPPSRGLGRGDIPRFPSQTGQTKIIEFLPGEIKNLTNSYVIPDADGIYTIVESYQFTYWSNVNDPKNYVKYSWPRVGSDEYPYLSFQTIDPRIEMIKIDGQWKPIFNITTDLFVESYTHNLAVAQDDYELEGRIYKDSIIPENLEYTEVYPLPSDLDKGATPFNWMVPVDPSWGEGKYYIKLLSKVKKALEPHPSFQDKYMSMYTGNPYFKPGNIAYQLDDKLNFGLDSKIDSEKIVIFNPTFYENDIELSVKSWSDNENFTISWDGVNYGKDLTTSVHLYPLQSREINFWVNAGHNPWVSSPVIETLKITVNGFLDTDEGVIEKEENLDYILDVDNGSLNWFNIKAIGFDPREIFLDTLNSINNEEIILRWQVRGSEFGLSAVAGQDYTVIISLINESDGSVLKDLVANFVIVEGIAELRFEYSFSYGNYLLAINLDSSNQLAENLSSGESGETDNYDVYTLPIVVTGCWYNMDGYMHLINFFGDDVRDTYNRCECPEGLIAIPDEGYCADPNFDGCANFGVFSECNNWIETLPGLCGWECDGSFCPPATINPGNCLSCNNISNMCSGYNNNESCVTDPCYKAAIYDCDILGCDEGETYGCVWDSGNVCKFQGSINGVSCRYKGEIVQECDESKGEMIVNFTSTDPLNCPTKQREVLCAQDIIIMSFFTMFNFILAIILITLIYIRREFSKK